ncbi:MAG: tRNA preQ1(34) S-adenosylmethionine ribosyltransferase-isomerase QueA [Candidatus Saccharibacteria bacterium]
MRISDFDYNLPDERIAQFPPKVRGQTRLITADRQSGAIENKAYADMIEYLNPGDVVVLNNTKVIKARLVALNASGKKRELLLIESHGTKANHHRQAIYRGTLHSGEVLQIGKTEVKIERVLKGGLAEVSSQANLLELAEKYGNVPLPPYMKRQANDDDQSRYQTVFAKTAGSVAAPTASLNFTEELAKKITAKGVKVVYLTLHVGLGTFLPIRTDEIEDHNMHSEYFSIPADTVRAIQSAKATGHKICSVGTTVARTLEYTKQQLLTEEPQAISGEANIFMYPGYKFKVVDILLTNFHAPRSTVLMLAAAFAGWDNLKRTYQIALAEKYDFLSYGDSMLIY